MERKVCRSPDVLGRLVSSSLHLQMILLCLDLLGSHVFVFFCNYHHKSGDCVELLLQTDTRISIS